MRQLPALILTLSLALPAVASDDPNKQPVQHLKVPDVTSMQDAKAIFLEMNHEMLEKQDIGMQEAAEIHIITYTLEKSVAYFADNLTGDKQAQAKEMAVVVENIHLASESNQFAALNQHLNDYAELVDQFLFGF